jgi:hypothetical protein
MGIFGNDPPPTPEELKATEIRRLYKEALHMLQDSIRTYEEARRLCVEAKTLVDDPPETIPDLERVTRYNQGLRAFKRNANSHLDKLLEVLEQYPEEP